MDEEMRGTRNRQGGRDRRKVGGKCWEGGGGNGCGTKAGVGVAGRERNGMAMAK